jgi:alpha-tubulin suppressor-like RCC1 family protein
MVDRRDLGEPRRSGGIMKVWGDRSYAVGILIAVALVMVGCATTPVVATGPGTPKVVEAGGTHSCAIDANRQVACWGQNSRGQLGVGSFTDSPTPLFVPGMSNATAVTASLVHSCAIRLGAVYCWGGNTDGQLGDGTTTDRPSPVQVVGLSNIVQIGTGVGHSCALDAAGVVSCWGDNTQSQLGNGSTVDSPTPVTVAGIAAVASISIRGFHSCALTTAFAARCWGDNGHGQLGVGTTVDSGVPVAPNGIPTASSLEAGTFHTCARVGATTSCWGNNAFGQIGNGTTTGSLVPVAVQNLLGVTSLALGAFHSCAIMAGGTAKCWGYNLKGGLGDGTIVNSTTPVPVAGLTGVTYISAGLTHTCAVVTGTDVWCWGDNGVGQMGNLDAGAMSSIPLPVAAPTSPPPVVPPDNVTTVSNYDLSCQALLGSTPVQNHTVAAETSVSHPESVDPGETFDVIVSSADVDVPLTQQSVALQNMNTFAFKFSIPDNVSLVSASYLPGINTGTGTPTVTNNGTYVQLNVPGPLTPGTTVTLPAIDLKLHADGPSGTPIVFTAPGTSYTDWNYSFSVSVVGVGSVFDRCFTTPAPTLATVTVN